MKNSNPFGFTQKFGLSTFTRPIVYCKYCGTPLGDLPANTSESAARSVIDASAGKQQQEYDLKMHWTCHLKSQELTPIQIAQLDAEIEKVEKKAKEEIDKDFDEYVKNYKRP